MHNQEQHMHGLWSGRGAHHDLEGFRRALTPGINAGPATAAAAAAAGGGGGGLRPPSHR